MIELTRLNGSPIMLNALLIERLERAPDTVINLTTGRQYVVQESWDKVKALIVEYLRSIEYGSTQPPVD